MAAMQELLLKIVKHGLVLQAFYARQFRRLEDLLAGVSMAALNAENRGRLTAAVYGARKDYKLEGMFPWEEKWFSSDLPAPPVKILLGGAGSGREIRHLAQLGYRIVAFDPVPSFVQHGRRRLQSNQCDVFLVGSFEDLAAPADEAARTFQDNIKARGPYDAVVCGWGSFTHVSTDTHRRSLLQQFNLVCPDGPVLLSFWMRGEESQIRKGRAWELGWKLGRLLANRKDATEPPDPGDWFLGNAGFGHFFTLEEIEELASSTGYELSRSPGGSYVGTFPHATLRPVK